MKLPLDTQPEAGTQRRRDDSAPEVRPSAGPTAGAGAGTGAGAGADSGARIARGLLLGAALAIVLYGLLALRADVGRVRNAMADFPIALVPIAMSLSFANYLVRFVRWERYRKRLGIELDPLTSFTIHIAGLALTVSPGKMGEAFKAWLIRRVNRTPVSVSAPIVVAERFTDLLAFLVLIAAGGLETASQASDRPTEAWIFWTTIALCAALLCLATSRRAQTIVLGIAARLTIGARLVPQMEASLASTRTLLAPREILVPTLLATLGWSLECFAFQLVASAFVPGGVSFLFAAHVFALAAVAGALAFVVPGGLGVTEASMQTLLARRYVALGVGAETASATALSATLVIRICTLWFAVAIGCVATLAFRMRFRRVVP